MKIFAYGSNMSTARLRQRVPSARCVGRAFLAGHSLRFHKRGLRDGSAKADAWACDDAGAGVWGVVFEIHDSQKPDLDRAEGLGSGYDEKQVVVTDDHGATHRAWMYHAEPSAIDPTVAPFAWYHALVLAGAREHGLPDRYLRDRIIACVSCSDPDADRATRHRAILVPANN
jgi:gamma-glutamylcyclotransferase